MVMPPSLLPGGAVRPPGARAAALTARVASAGGRHHAVRPDHRLGLRRPAARRGVEPCRRPRRHPRARVLPRRGGDRLGRRAAGWRLVDRVGAADRHRRAGGDPVQRRARHRLAAVPGERRRDRLGRRGRDLRDRGRARARRARAVRVRLAARAAHRHGARTDRPGRRVLGARAGARSRAAAARSSRASRAPTTRSASRSWSRC